MRIPFMGPASFFEGEGAGSWTVELDRDFPPLRGRHFPIAVHGDAAVAFWQQGVGGQCGMESGEGIGDIFHFRIVIGRGVAVIGGDSDQDALSFGPSQDLPGPVMDEQAVKFGVFQRGGFYNRGERSCSATAATKARRLQRQWPADVRRGAWLGISVMTQSMALHHLAPTKARYRLERPRREPNVED